MAKIVFVDFDDTLFYTKHTVEKAAKILLGKDLTKEEIRKLPKEIKSQIYTKAFNELYKEAIPNKKLINILNDLKKRGYKIVILTARLEDNIEATKYLLSKYNIPYDCIVVRKDKSIKDEEWKSQIIRNCTAKDIILFEDKQENIRYIVRSINKPIKTFLVNKNLISEFT